MALADVFFTPSILITLAICLILISALGLFFIQKMNQQNHKLNTMFDLVSTLAQEVNSMKNLPPSSMNENMEMPTQHIPMGGDMLQDDDIDVRKVNMIHVSDGEGDDSDSVNDEDSDDIDDSDDEDETDDSDDDKTDNVIINMHHDNGNDEDDSDDEDEDEDEDDESDDEDDSDDEEEEQENETSEIRIIDQFNQIGNDEQIQAQINDTDLSVSHAEEGLQDLSIEPLVGDLSELEQMEGEDLASTQENLEDISLSSNGVKSLDIVADYKKTSIAKLRDIVVAKGIVSDPSKLKKNELLKLLDA